MTIVFDGRKLAKEKEKKLAVAVAEFKKTHGFAPKLVSLLIGDNPASVKYLAIKKAVSERVGMEFEEVKFREDAESVEITKLIKEKNKDPRIHGIMIQMPLPKKFSILNSQFSIIGAIAPSKDVDCLTPENFGWLMMGQPRFLPATVSGILTILKTAKYKLAGAIVTIIGGSNIVGKPLALVLSNLGATVTLCRSKTKNLSEFTKRADILISATGRPNLIKKEMVKKGAVVIDVGYPSPDVDFAAVAEVASFITPVPGGVGPLTVVSLLENVLLAGVNLAHL